MCLCSLGMSKLSRQVFMPLKSLTWSHDEKCSRAPISREHQNGLSRVSEAARILDTRCSWLTGSCFKDRHIFHFPNLSKTQPHCALKGPPLHVSLLNGTSHIGIHVTDQQCTRLSGCFVHLCAGAAGHRLHLRDAFKGKVSCKGSAQLPAASVPSHALRPCHGRLARRGLFHQLPQRHVGLWL